MTGRDLVSASLRLIGALAPGESPAAQEATDGLSSLNRMLGGWSNESLMVPARVIEVFSLTIGQGSYTIGPSGDFDTERPMHIETLVVRDSTTSPAHDLPPLKLLSRSEWAAISQKEMQSTYPWEAFIEGTFPLQTIRLHPVPAASHSLVVHSRKPLSAIASLDSEFEMPPGYEEAVIYNLAMRLAPEYGRPLLPEIMGIAMESKAGLKRTNDRPEYLRVDEALTAPGAAFDWNTGDYRR